MQPHRSEVVALGLIRCNTKLLVELSQSRSQTLQSGNFQPGHKDHASLAAVRETNLGTYYIFSVIKLFIIVFQAVSKIKPS